MIAIQLVIVLAGIFILAKGRINFSKDRELVRPSSTIIGLVLILIAALPFFLSALNDIYIVIILAVLAIIVSFFFSRKIVTTI